MTINVAVVTSDALVLGCDSISTVTELLINPQVFPVEYTGSGRQRISFSTADLTPRVTNAWDGVTKMFALSSAERTPVAAVTAGLARLNNRSIKSYADEFLSDQTVNSPTRHTVEEVANNFLRFMRHHYDQHYADSDLPSDCREGPAFLVGGYDAASHLPSLFRVNVQYNHVLAQYSPGNFGAAWDGQSDAVERFIRGYDTVLRSSIESQVNAEFTALRKTMGKATLQNLRKILSTAGVSLPERVETELPEAPGVSIDWDGFGCEIAYGNLTTQDSIDLTACLVKLQSGKAKFAKGIATVGGRTCIGLIRKQEGFQMLNKPDLQCTRGDTA